MNVNFSKTRRDIKNKSYFDNISSLNIEHSQNKTDDQ